MNCSWEQEGNQATACPSCGSNVYTMHDTPVCKVCGKKTVATSGSHLGATWDCPEGHYQEVLSRTDRYCYKDGRLEIIETWGS